MGKKSKKTQGGMADAGSGHEPSQDAGNSTEKVADREHCGHYSRDVPHLDKLLWKIISYKQLAACKDCRGAGGPEGSAAKEEAEKSDIWVCLDCGQHFCGGLVSDTIPYGHARRHARKDRHSWLARYDKPIIVYCVSCKNEVSIKMPTKMPVVEKVSTPAAATPAAAAATLDKVVGAVGSNGFVLANSHGNVIKGLLNLGNTCFFNAVLQSLLALDTFRNKMLGPAVPRGDITMSLKKLFVETSASNDAGGALSPATLFRRVSSKYPQFEGSQMQDSHELLRCFLDGLDTEETEARKLAEDATSAGVPTIVHSIFGGQLSSTVSSTECTHWSVKHDQFLDLSLPVPSRKTPAKSVSSPPAKKTSLGDMFGEPEVSSDANKETGTARDIDVMAWSSNSDDYEVDTSNSPVSVEDCLALYTKTELLSEKWHCEHCSIAIVDPNTKELKEGEEMAASASAQQNNGHNVDVAAEETSAPVTCADKKVESAANAEEVVAISIPSETHKDNEDGFTRNIGRMKMVDKAHKEKENQNKQKKDETKVFRNARRRILISKAPPVLTFTLNRFSRDSHGQFKKLKGHVCFKETLDIQQFMDPSFKENNSTTYRLIAVVEHMGTVISGHYNAYVRADKIGGWQQQCHASKSWFYASDSQVREISLGEVQNREAYILFYERVLEQDDMSGGLFMNP